jgi:hypothetical protein
VPRSNARALVATLLWEFFTKRSAYSQQRSLLPLISAFADL